MGKKAEKKKSTDFDLTIKRNELEAMLPNVCRDETRFNICSVLVEMLPDKTVILVSTSGHALTAVRCEEEHKIKLTKPLQVLILRNDLERILKATDKTMISAVLSCKDGHYALCDIPFKPADGTYPDWRRIVPDEGYKETGGSYNQFLIQDAIKTLALYDSKRHTAKNPFHDYKLFQHGTECTVMRGYFSDCLVLIMPMRAGLEVSNTGRDWAFPLKGGE